MARSQNLLPARVTSASFTEYVPQLSLADTIANSLIYESDKWFRQQQVSRENALVDVFSYGNGHWRKRFVPDENGDWPVEARFEMQVTVWRTGEMQITEPLWYIPTRKEKKRLKEALRRRSMKAACQRK